MLGRNDAVHGVVRAPLRVHLGRRDGPVLLAEFDDLVDVSGRLHGQLGHAGKRDLGGRLHGQLGHAGKRDLGATNSLQVIARGEHSLEIADQDLETRAQPDLAWTV